LNLAAGVLVADRFKLVRLLGKGGMGAVWLAEHTGLDVPCAIKFIHPQAAESAEIRARFEREAKAAAQLRSPHVVQVLDHGVWEGAPYIAMEFLEGEDLAHRLSKYGVLPPPEVASLAAQIGRALTRAHAAGLVHRDLKPANVFLVRDDDREIAKVLDFGVAKATALGNDGNTKTGAVLGTPYYMSPEQAKGSREVDHRSDLWALAVVVFQCLTGHLPFQADGFGELIVKIITEAPPVPSSIAIVPPGFDAWWARAVARDPGYRFQSAKEMTEALSIALGVTMPVGTAENSALMARPMVAGGLVGMPTPMPYGGSQPGLQTPSQPGLQTPSQPGFQGTSQPGFQGTSQPGFQGTSQPGSPGTSQPNLSAGTAMQQAVSVAPGAPAKSRSSVPVIVGAAVVGGVLLGVAAWAMTGRGAGSPAAGGPPSAAVTAPVTASAPATASASAAVTAPAAVTVSAAPPASATASAAPIAPAAANHPASPARHTPSAKPTAGPKAKSDFGF